MWLFEYCISFKAPFSFSLCLVEPDQELRQFIKIFLTVFKSSVHKSVFAKLIFHVAAVFSMRKESLNACPFYDSLLTEAVKEQIMADNLCPKLEFINKVTTFFFSFQLFLYFSTNLLFFHKVGSIKAIKIY